MTEPAADRVADREPTEPYVPPDVTRLGTLAELTGGVNFGDGGDLNAYQS